MPSFDVVLQSASVVVLGGPSTVELQLDTGATGQRGSQIYMGLGNPVSSSAVTDPLLGDLYIDVQSGSNTYSWVYQYISKPAGNTWEAVSLLVKPGYSKIHSLNFTTGSASVSIPIASIAPTLNNPQTTNFAVTTTFENTNAIASSVVSKQILSNNLIVTIKAAEYNGSWSDLSGSKSVVVNINITS